VGETNGRIAIETSDYDAAWNYGTFSISRDFMGELGYCGYWFAGRPAARATISRKSAGHATQSGADRSSMKFPVICQRDSRFQRD
jgi:hypothetical protein